MHKAWVTLYTCAASRAICLDLTPNMNSVSFIQSFKYLFRAMVAQIMLYQITDQILFLTIAEVLLLVDLQKAFEFIPRSMVHRIFRETRKKCKDLLIRDLKGSRLSCEKMPTVLFECEAILNNRSLTYIYPTDLTLPIYPTT